MSNSTNLFDADHSIELPLLVVLLGNMIFSQAVFQRPYRYFSIALKVFFSLSDRYTFFTSNWPWIEICENVVSSKRKVKHTLSTDVIDIFS